jgi:hypothetical protein
MRHDADGGPRPAQVPLGLPMRNLRKVRNLSAIRYLEEMKSDAPEIHSRTRGKGK